MILQTMGVKIYKDCLCVVFDSKGDSYEIPNYCINWPHKYIIKENEALKTILNVFHISMSPSTLVFQYSSRFLIKSSLLISETYASIFLIPSPVCTPAIENYKY